MAAGDECGRGTGKMCPFLSKIESPTSFDFASVVPSLPSPGSGPIFEDESSFELAFSLFHGKGGVVPLARHDKTKEADCRNEGKLVSPTACPFSNSYDKLLGQSAAAISLSPFGPLGPFSYDSFRARNGDFGKKTEKQDRLDEKPSQKEDKPTEPEPQKPEQERVESKPAHDALGSEWLATGNCPIARSYRAFSGIFPLVAAAMPKLPSNVVYRCPPAIVALRAAVASHPAMKALRPQALPVRTLAIGAMGLMLNIPMGVWREHCEKFSPQWIIAVHASVPFVAVLRKAALMPKYAMVFTIAASVIGQTIGAKAERSRVARMKRFEDSSAEESRHDKFSEMGEHLRAQPSLKVARRMKRRGDRGAGEPVQALASLQGCSTTALEALGGLIDKIEEPKAICGQC